jgi:hypothetical protein
VATLAAVIVPSAAVTASSGQAASDLKCTGDASTPTAFNVPVTLSGQYLTDPGPTTASGYYVAPKGQAKGLVVFSHGHGAGPEDWFGQMQRVAKNDGVIALALYYPGEIVSASTPPSTYGWRVREGAQAGIAAAQAFLQACPKLQTRTIVNYGVSMGGNTSGLIAAAAAQRPNGRTLFDYWFDIEGVTNANETYLAAQALAAGGSAAGLSLADTAKQAIKEIEEENGGTPAEKPAAYADLAVVTHSKQIAASGIKGIVIVHGVDDGEVPYNQSREEQVSLASVGVGTDFYSVARDASDSTNHGVQLDQELLGALPTGYTSPLAGHGFEGSQTQLVIETGLRALDKVFHLGPQPSRTTSREFLVDGTMGTVRVR